MTLSQFLTWLVTGGSVVVAAAFVSWAANNWAWFKAQTRSMKQAIMIGACLGLSLVAWAVTTFVPPAVLLSLAAPFGIAVATLTALLGNQAWHALVNQANPAVALVPVVQPPGVVPVGTVQTVVVPLVR